MAKFAYNNVKKASTGHILFELNCSFQLWTFYKKGINPHSQLKSANKVANELNKLIIICRKNLYHIKELQKRYYDKYVKPKSYAAGEKVCLTSKYIITKQKRKVEAKFFKLFGVSHQVRKEVYKWELSKKWRMHNILQMSLLEQDIIRKRRVHKMMSRLEFENNYDGEEYKLKAIYDSAALYKGVRRSPTRPLLFRLLKRLTKKEKHLQVSIGHPRPLEAYYYLPERAFWKANSNFSTNRLHSTDSDVYSEVYSQIKSLKY